MRIIIPGVYDLEIQQLGEHLSDEQPYDRRWL